MASLKSISITVGEQITIEQLIELSIVMRISRYDLLEICPRGNNKMVIIIFPCS